MFLFIFYPVQKWSRYPKWNRGLLATLSYIFSFFNFCVPPIDWWAVETEKYRSELAKVRAELEPWEKDLIEHKGKLEVACTESKLLN